jgi:PIN domain nuclease of toxin-antitoxin system
MRLLLDTHVLVWLAFGDARLGEPLLERLSVEPGVTISVLARWELGIKARNGRFPHLAIFDRVVAQYGFETLPIMADHVRAATELPLHHRDPFDRMLIGQAICEDMLLVTADAIFVRYPCKVIGCCG